MAERGRGSLMETGILTPEAVWARLGHQSGGRRIVGASVRMGWTRFLSRMGRGERASGRRGLGVFGFLAVVALVLAGCVAMETPPRGDDPEVRSLATSMPPTPTIDLSTPVVVFVPMVVEGIPLEPTPKATRDPRFGPTGTPSQLVEVAYSVTRQRTTEDGLGLEVEGEVLNPGPGSVQAVRVVVDATGPGGSCGRGALTLLGKSEAIVAAGGRWPFAGVVPLTCAPDHIGFTTVALQTDGVPLQLTAEQASVGVSASGDLLLAGTLRNGTSASVAYPRAVVTIRNADGRYLAGGLAYGEASALAPGATMEFNVTIPRDKTLGWALFDVIGTGERR